MGQTNREEGKTACASGPAVFGCPVCGDCLSSQDYLDKHMLDCHAERPQGKLECCYCPYTTNRRSNMTSHERTHTGSKPFSCPSCNKNFTRKTGLVKHQMVHTGEKPYTCTTCGQQFRYLSVLARHTKLHLDSEKPHACRYCGRSFTMKGNLAMHLVTHTRERQHACRVCGKKFTIASYARRHERRKHGTQIQSSD